MIRFSENKTSADLERSLEMKKVKDVDFEDDKFPTGLPSLPEENGAGRSPIAIQNDNPTKTLYRAISWGDEKLTRPGGLQRIKPKAGEFVRFAILDFPPLTAQIHYVEGTGSVICAENGCCERYGESRWTAVVLAQPEMER